MELESALLEVHRAEGATLGTYFGCTLPARFGSVESEYRAARETAILSDTNYHAVFRFEGPDRARYLNAVLTSDVKSLTPGEGAGSHSGGDRNARAARFDSRDHLRKRGRGHIRTS
jgi:glycine cleavage system aminomethyltransferase T